jgi:C4-dicarboxylate-specific signal transduction histidine kinase
MSYRTGPPAMSSDPADRHSPYKSGPFNAGPGMTDAAIQILLVEDNAGDAELLKRELTASPFGPFSITHVRRLTEALTKLRKKRHHAVLLDLRLPDSHGLKTLREIQKAKPREVPVLIVTGLEDDKLLIKALQEGADDFLIKGVPRDNLRARSVRYAIDRKAAEQSARSREAQMAHLSRISTSGQLASGLAHELCQPLASILNYAKVCLQYIESHKGSPENALTAIQSVVSETGRAGAVVSSMRSFVRKQQPKSVSLDLNTVVRESVGMMDFELRHRHLRPRLLLAADLPSVSGDAVRIEQVLVNLLLNGAQAMDEAPSPRDSLTVKTALDDGGHSVRVSVIDTGPGISAQDLGRLFEPFFTTKPKGLGIGLSICRSIIESQGGYLTAAPNPERGMRFSFTVPVARETVATAKRRRGTRREENN